MRELLSLPFPPLAIKTASLPFRFCVGAGLRPAPAAAPTIAVHLLTEALYCLAGKTGGTRCFVKTAERPIPIQVNSARRAAAPLLSQPPYGQRQARAQSAVVRSQHRLRSTATRLPAARPSLVWSAESSHF